MTQQDQQVLSFLEGFRDEIKGLREGQDKIIEKLTSMEERLQAQTEKNTEIEVRVEELGVEVRDLQEKNDGLEEGAETLEAQEKYISDIKSSHIGLCDFT